MANQKYQRQFNKRLMRRCLALAKKYYNKDDLNLLAPYQLDKVIGWATKHDPDQGKNADRKAGRSAYRYAKKQS